MSIVYLNGQFLPLLDARISVLDRGFLFADGVYEVIPAYNGKLFRLEHHLERLDNSMRGIHLSNPLSNAQWSDVLNALVERNGGGNISVYLHVTRGADEKRDHLYSASTEQTIFVMTTPIKPVSAHLLEQGAKLIVLDDIRWQHCNLKTIALLPNVMLRNQAHAAGADEAILVRDGYATEATVSNFFVVKDGVVLTPPKSEFLLPGITRDLVLELARDHGMPCEETSIGREMLYDADEIWITSSTKEVVAATRLDGEYVGDGLPGPMWKLMLRYYQEYKMQLKN
ncbi:MAG: D-amino acid aminotransferase [Gammaproteobacteria bacterium]|nr:D-amino acid aminotransferase [Gammaproteobacteria bacterium]